MHSIAHYGLGLGIITSALGALLLCLLVFRYGFTPPDDESPEERSRRQFVTRLGHAAGAVCFALTAGLSAVVLGVSDGRSAQGPAVFAADPSPRLRALSSENQRLGEAVHTLEERLTETDAIVQKLRVTSTETETALQRLRTASSETSAKIDRLERTTATARVAPAPVARDARRLDRLDPTPGASRKSVPGTDLRAPSLRPAAVSAPPPRPATLPPVDPPAPAWPTEQQATTTPDARPDPPELALSPRTSATDRAPVSPTRTAVVAERASTGIAERAPARVAVSGPAAESDTMESAARGVTRLGGTLARGVLSVGKSIRRFVEDLQ